MKNSIISRIGETDTMKIWDSFLVLDGPLSYRNMESSYYWATMTNR